MRGETLTPTLKDEHRLRLFMLYVLLISSLKMYKKQNVNILVTVGTLVKNNVASLSCVVLNTDIRQLTQFQATQFQNYAILER
jgi:hypothetical protein